MILSSVLRRVGAVCMFVAGLPVLGEACSCGFITPQEALESSDAALVGTVISREEPPPSVMEFRGDTIQVVSDMDMIRYRLVVSRGWKGEPIDTVAIYSMRDACGFDFRIGRMYLVYARLESHRNPEIAWPVGTSFPALGTSRCSRTGTMTHAREDLAALGPPGWER